MMIDLRDLAVDRNNHFNLIRKIVPSAILVSHAQLIPLDTTAIEPLEPL